MKTGTDLLRSEFKRVSIVSFVFYSITYIVLGLIHPSIFDKVNYFFGLATFMLFWATLVFVLHLIFGEKICKFKRLFFKKGLK